MVAVACQCFDGSDACLLTADLSVECSHVIDGRRHTTAEYSELLALAYFAIALYPIGVPVLFAALLHAGRHDITSGRGSPYTRSSAPPGAK